MTRSIGILLEEILEAIGLLRRYTAGLTYEEFAENVEKQDSVTRRLEIIGEAAKGIPEHLRAKYPDVPWRDITGRSRCPRSRVLPDRPGNGLGHGPGRPTDP